jgi:hypothetical protein
LYPHGKDRNRRPGLSGRAFAFGNALGFLLFLERQPVQKARYSCAADNVPQGRGTGFGATIPMTGQFFNYLAWYFVNFTSTHLNAAC